MKEEDIKKIWQEQPTSVRIGGNEVVLSLQQELEKFEKRIRIRDIREIVIGIAVIIFFGVALLNVPYPGAKIGAAIIIVGCINIIYRLRRAQKQRPSENPLQDIRSNLLREKEKIETQISLLKTVWRWYLLPLMVGVILFYVSFPQPITAKVLYVAAVCLLYGGIWWVNHYAANRYLLPLQNKVEKMLNELNEEKKTR